MTNREPLRLPTSHWQGWLRDRSGSQLDAVRRHAETLRSGAASPDAVLDMWNDLSLALRNASALASVLANVHPDETVRTAVEEAEQEVSRLETEIGLDRKLYDVLAAVDGRQLDEQARRLLELTLRDFRRAGVDRDEEVRTRLRELAERETDVGQRFARNIRDDVRSIRVHPDALDGLPEDFLASHQAGEDGLVEVTTEYPDYVPFMTFSRDRLARARLITDFLNRAPTRPTRRSSPSCSRCAASTRGCSATTGGPPSTPRPR